MSLWNWTVCDVHFIPIPCWTTLGSHTYHYNFPCMLALILPNCESYLVQCKSVCPSDKCWTLLNAVPYKFPSLFTQTGNQYVPSTWKTLVTSLLQILFLLAYICTVSHVIMVYIITYECIMDTQILVAVCPFQSFCIHTVGYILIFHSGLVITERAVVGVRTWGFLKNSQNAPSFLFFGGRGVKSLDNPGFPILLLYYTDNLVLLYDLWWDIYRRKGFRQWANCLDEWHTLYMQHAHCIAHCIVWQRFTG